MVTVRWSVTGTMDERLSVGEDGTARLVVLVPRDGGDTVGVFTGRTDTDVSPLLSGGDLVIGHRVDGADAERAQVADRVAAHLRSSPERVVRFGARTEPGQVVLTVTALGDEPAEFELDPDGCGVHFSRSGSPVGWVPLPPVAIGFMTADIVSLGGVRRPAVVAPGQQGAIAVDVAVSAEADEVRVRVAGTIALTGDLIDAPEPFVAVTSPVVIES